MKKCPFCKKEIESSSITCPICNMVLIEKRITPKMFQNMAHTPAFKLTKENAEIETDNKTPNNRQFFLKTVELDGWALESIPENLKNDKEIVLEAVKTDRYVLSIVAPIFQDDPEIVRAAISLDTLTGSNLNGPVLKYASPRLRSNRKMVLDAVRNYGEAIEYASPDFDDDKEIIFTALNNMWVDTYPYGGSVIYNCISPRLYMDDKVMISTRDTKEKIYDIDSFFKGVDIFFNNLANWKYNKKLKTEGKEEYSKVYETRKKERLEKWQKDEELWQYKMDQWQQNQKTQKYEKYLELRKQIELIPIYNRWKQDVIKKCGDKCQLCGSNKKPEVHHLTSLYSILRQNNISSIDEKEKILNCKQLWDVNNGEVLCKKCHDNMESSKNREIFSKKL